MPLARDRWVWFLRNAIFSASIFCNYGSNARNVDVNSLNCDSNPACGSKLDRHQQGLRN